MSGRESDPHDREVVAVAVRQRGERCDADVRSIRARDRLVDLVLTGRKRATAALLSEWESAQDPLEVGRCCAVVDSAGQRVAVVQTTELRLGTFRDVDWDWIVDAGEGEQSAEEWPERYLDYYQQTTGTRPAPATPVVYERFRLVDAREPTG